MITLSGTGLAGVAQLSASSLSFAAQTVGTNATAQTITITNTSNGNLTFSGIQATGDFSQTNNCTSVAAQASCAIQVTFTPTSSGSRTGTLSLADSAANSPQLVTLSGSGIDFSMPSSGGTASVVAGGTATYQVSVDAIGGNFSSAVNLTCAGVPAFSTCTVSPNPVTPGSTSTSVTVTIRTSGATAQLSTPGERRGPLVASLLAVPGFGLMGLFLIGSRGRRSQVRMLTMVVALVILTVAGVGCSGVSNPPVQQGNTTPAGAYTVVLIGSSGSVQHFSSLTLTVQ